MASPILDTDQKALEINLDERIYGTFAEIGAGQEVARIFFKVGAAAGTIAKTMSAYDKIYSDEIYGLEPSGRYVCESRLKKMLDHEYRLMEERLERHRLDTNFFVFADTVAALDYQRTVSGHGWLGLRFQLHPHTAPNDLILHVRMLDRDTQLQAASIGILGVNIVYGCYRYAADAETLIKSLKDGLRGRVTIDMISINGPDFTNIDNRYLSLLLVQHGLTEVAMFGPDGKNIHGSEFLYRKSLMIARGHYRPPTLVSFDAIQSSFAQFIRETDVDPANACIMCELSLENLMVDGKITPHDFLDRAQALNAIGQSVIVSNCSNHQQLINFLADFKIHKLGLVIGVRELQDIITQRYEENKNGNLLVTFGELFTGNIRIYAYPVLNDTKNGELLTATTMAVPEGITFLYQYLLKGQHIVEVTGYNEDLLSIFPQNVLHIIRTQNTGWEKFVPPELTGLIKEKGLFDWKISVPA